MKAVVLMSGKPNSFVAGADITMLEKCKTASDAEKLSRDGQIQFERLEKSKKPVVAAIMGTCMGGGLELALACHYRIAVNDPKTQMAVPEVMLGLLPGAGGTQRLPRLISVQNALSMMLTGCSLRALFNHHQHTVQEKQFVPRRQRASVLWILSSSLSALACTIQ